MLNLNYKNMETKNCDCLETTKELINKNISERKNNPKGFKIIESNLLVFILKYDYTIILL
jgi:hypothetical protein